jgi:hypothetical protein
VQVDGGDRAVGGRDVPEVGALGVAGHRRGGAADDAVLEDVLRLRGGQPGLEREIARGGRGG